MILYLFSEVLAGLRIPFYPRTGLEPKYYRQGIYKKAKESAKINIYIKKYLKPEALFSAAEPPEQIPHI